MLKPTEIKVIVKESDLPPGRVVSHLGDDIPLPEKDRENYLIWKIDSAADRICWLICTEDGMKNVRLMNIEAMISKKEYKLNRKAKIDAKLLRTLYDRRANEKTKKVDSDDSKAVMLFEETVESAVKQKVSDIHIEVRSNGAQIKMRKNGSMMPFGADDGYLKREDADNLCSVIYNVLAENKDTAFNPKAFQAAAVDYPISTGDVKLRYQSLPIFPHGYDVVLRVLPIGKDESFTPLQQLGYYAQQAEELITICSHSVGALIIAGVTGSGKSTTLKNLLMFINDYNDYELKVYSIEDPPEYKIPYVSQLPVVRKDKDKGNSGVNPFAEAIKACMRGDPDVIMIGEIRDNVTAHLAKDAIQSGHQVLTTIHATSAIGIFDRLSDMGLTKKTLGLPDFINGTLYQKLMPIVCDNCSIDFHEIMKSPEAKEEDLKLYKRISDVMKDENRFKLAKLRRRNSEGCPKCHAGIRGRTVCAEVISIDHNMLQLIGNDDVLGLVKYWRSLSDGMYWSENMRGKTCMEHAFHKMINGVCDPQDLERSFRPINEMYGEHAKIDESEKIEQQLKELIEKYKEKNGNPENLKELKNLLDN